MDLKNNFCEACVDASTCTKDIIGYKRFNTNEKPYGKLYETEKEAWDIGDRKYDGSFEVYPICR